MIFFYSFTKYENTEFILVLNACFEKKNFLKTNSNNNPTINSVKLNQISTFRGNDSEDIEIWHRC